MDPVSITSGCVGLLTGVAHLTSQITSFVSSVRDARKDMAAVSGELVSLSLCLETLRDDSMKINYPEAFHENLLTVLKNCDTVTTEMTTLLGKLSSANLMRKIQWSAMGRDDMKKLRSSLESHKSALEIGLDMTSLLVISAVKSEVAEVKADTAHIPSIKQDTSHIEGLVQQIGLLRLQLENIHMSDAKARHLQMFLDQSTTYAETVMDSMHEEDRKPYATDGSESDEPKNEQEVLSIINSTKSIVTQRVSSIPEQLPNSTLRARPNTHSYQQHPQQQGHHGGDGYYDESSYYNAHAKSPYQQDGGYYEDHQRYQDGYYQDQYYDQNGLNDNEIAAEAAHDSDSETSGQPPTVRDYVAQSTTNTSAFSENGTTGLATNNLISSRASRQLAKAPGHYPRKPVALSSDRVQLPSRYKEAIEKATLLRNAMNQKEQDRLHKSLEVAIRGSRSLADRFKKGPWLSDDRGNPDKIKKLLDRGADPNRLSYGYDLCTIEMEEGGQRLHVLELLLMRGAFFQLLAAGRWLAEAVRFHRYHYCNRDWGEGGGKKRLVTALLDCGVSPNAKDAHGCPALSNACVRTDTEIFQLLLDWGAIADDAALEEAVLESGNFRSSLRPNFPPKERSKIVGMLLGHKISSISTAGKEYAAKKAVDLENWPLVDTILKHDASLAANSPVVQRKIAADRKRRPREYERPWS